MQEPKMVIIVRKDLSMKKGKMAAQVAAASMQFILENDDSKRGLEFHVELSEDEAAWLRGQHKKIILSVNSQFELEQLIFKGKMLGIPVYPIIDNDPADVDECKTLTCAAFGPATDDWLDKLTGSLALF